MSFDCSCRSTSSRDCTKWYSGSIACVYVQHLNNTAIQEIDTSNGVIFPFLTLTLTLDTVLLIYCRYMSICGYVSIQFIDIMCVYVRMYCSTWTTWQYKRSTQVTASSSHSTTQTPVLSTSVDGLVSCCYMLEWLWRYMSLTYLLSAPPDPLAGLKGSYF